MSHIVTGKSLTTTNRSGRTVFLNQGDTVPDDLPAVEYARLIEAQLIEEIQDVPEGEPTSDWKVDQLRAYAEQNSIDLGDAKKKGELLAAIAAHQ